MHSARIPDVSRMHSRHFPHTFWMRPASDKKGSGSCISLAATLLRGFALARMWFVHILDVYCVHFGCILYVFQMRLVCIPDASHTPPRRVPDASCTHPARIPDASRMRSRRM